MEHENNCEVNDACDIKSTAPKANVLEILEAQVRAQAWLEMRNSNFTFCVNLLAGVHNEYWEYYGRLWRLWDIEPTEEQRWATRWGGEDDEV